jgi:hypothetical protein
MRVTISHPASSLPGRSARLLRHLCWILILVAPGASGAQSRQPSEDAFADRGWHLELGGHTAIEAWNYNNTHEKMYGWHAGLTYGLRRGILVIVRAPLYYVDQRGTDAFLLGVTAGVRGRIYRRGRLSVFLELDVGLSEADVAVPPRGTRFNYLALGGAGTTVRLKGAVHLLASMRWVHVSNSGVAGRDRNPDIEALGPQIGVLMGF